MCGQCCTYEIGNEIKRCKFLQGTIGKHTFCPIYENRIGIVIDKEILDYNYNNTGKRLVKKIICGLRKDPGHNRFVEGCTELI